MGKPYGPNTNVGVDARLGSYETSGDGAKKYRWVYFPTTIAEGSVVGWTTTALAALTAPTADSHWGVETAGTADERTVGVAISGQTTAGTRKVQVTGPNSKVLSVFTTTVAANVPVGFGSVAGKVANYTSDTPNPVGYTLAICTTGATSVAMDLCIY